MNSHKKRNLLRKRMQALRPQGLRSIRQQILKNEVNILKRTTRRGWKSLYHKIPKKAPERGNNTQKKQTKGKNRRKQGKEVKAIETIRPPEPQQKIQDLKKKKGRDKKNPCPKTSYQKQRSCKERPQQKIPPQAARNPAQQKKKLLALANHRRCFNKKTKQREERFQRKGEKVRNQTSLGQRTTCWQLLMHPKG